MKFLSRVNQSLISINLQWKNKSLIDLKNGAEDIVWSMPRLIILHQN
jgi:hypothetical protein